MAISHELSGEIATALFAARARSPRELNDLKEMVFAIHATLERLGHDVRSDRESQSMTKPAVLTPSTMRAKGAR
ncbi:MAG TPA: hypothetical protein VFD48_13965 [Pyrinomonadaceae bacterium]|nr:hypothetical protein [Pyrinomonadaceae bacterium]